MPQGRDDLENRVATLESQVALLMNAALRHGDLSINAIRATLGLPDLDPAKAA